MTAEECEPSEQPKEQSSKWRWYQQPFLALCFMGSGGFWIYPELLFRSKGGVWMVSYVLLLLVIVVPLILLQLRLGALTRCSIVTMFNRHVPAAKGIGLALMLQLGIVVIIRQVEMGHVLHYMFECMGEQRYDRMPWAHCNNTWNTYQCCDRLTRQCPQTYRQPEIPNRQPPNVARPVDVNDPLAGIRDIISPPRAPPRYVDQPFNPLTPQEEYFLRGFLQMSTGYGTIGGVVNHLVWPLLLSLLFVLCMVVGGPRIFAWVVTVVGTVAVLTLIMLLGYVYSEFRFARDGWKFFFTSRWDDELIDFPLWSQAVVFLVTSTGAWAGILPTYGKFTAPTTEKWKYSSWVPIAVVMLILPNLAATMIAGYVGATAERLNQPYAQLITGGSWVHMTLVPTLMTYLKLAPWWGFLFYACVFLFTSLIQALIIVVIIECISEVCYTKRVSRALPRHFVFRMLVACACVIAIFLLALPLITKGGFFLIQLINQTVYWLDFMYFIIFAVALVIVYGRVEGITTMERIVIGTMFGIGGFITIVFRMHDYNVYTGFDLLRYMTASGRLEYYPQSAHALGWIVAIGPLLIGMLCGLAHTIYKTGGNTEKRMVHMCGGDKMEEVLEDGELILESSYAMPVKPPKDQLRKVKMPKLKSAYFKTSDRKRNPCGDDEHYDEPPSELDDSSDRPIHPGSLSSHQERDMSPEEDLSLREEDENCKPQEWSEGDVKKMIKPV